MRVTIIFNLTHFLNNSAKLRINLEFFQTKFTEFCRYWKNNGVDLSFRLIEDKPNLNKEDFERLVTCLKKQDQGACLISQQDINNFPREERLLARNIMPNWTDNVEKFFTTLHHKILLKSSSSTILPQEVSPAPSAAANQPAVANSQAAASLAASIAPPVPAVADFSGAAASGAAANEAHEHKVFVVRKLQSTNVTSTIIHKRIIHHLRFYFSQKYTEEIKGKTYHYFLDYRQSKKPDGKRRQAISLMTSIQGSSRGFLTNRRIDDITLKLGENISFLYGEEELQATKISIRCTPERYRQLIDLLQKEAETLLGLEPGTLATWIEKNYSEEFHANFEIETSGENYGKRKSCNHVSDKRVVVEGNSSATNRIKRHKIATASAGPDLPEIDIPQAASGAQPPAIFSPLSALFGAALLPTPVNTPDAPASTPQQIVNTPNTPMTPGTHQQLTSAARILGALTSGGSLEEMKNSDVDMIATANGAHRTSADADAAMNVVAAPTPMAVVDANSGGTSNTDNRPPPQLRG